MIDNIHARDELTGFARKQSKDRIERSVKKPELEAALAEGWEIRRKNRKSVRVSKPRKKADLLESRVWTLLYRMGFPVMSGKGGGNLWMNPRDPNGPKDQLDVVAVDDEVGLCVECKSYETPAKDPRLPQWLARLASMKKRFASAVKSVAPTDTKRHVASVAFTWDLIIRDVDQRRAEEQNVVLFDEHDLQYYEALVRHLGPAARYQLLAEVFRGRQISGLEIKVPALRTKMGKCTCYTFSVKPSYLLKVAYVAHRKKGKAIDVDAYQRMVSKGRLRKIADFISDGGIFPTNIVVNIEKPKYARFDRGGQDGGGTGGVFGWLTLAPAYGCAWIVDGQHRLLAFSGHDKVDKGFLNVLAFEGLTSSKQAQFFVDINSEQKRVKRSLLVELAADLKWEAENEEDRIQAVVSKASMALDMDLDSPLRNRILLSDARRTDTRCVSLTSLFSALNRYGFFIARRKKGVVEYGPLWVGDPTISLKRTVHVLKGWLGKIATAAGEWWELGAGQGGGLAMNNGVTVCLNLLRSVYEHLGATKLRMLDDHDLVGRVRPYAKAIGDYFARMPVDERQAFRQLQGSDGQLTGTRMCQEALRHEFPDYTPPGLDDWIQRREANNNEKGHQLTDRIERMLQDNVLAMLKEEFDADPDQWWWEGVPKAVRGKVDDRINQSDGKAGTREQNFDLIHYREIIKLNWNLFKDTFGYGSGGSKDKKTSWISEVGQMRNVVAHTSRREFLGFDKLAQLESYAEWLDGQLARLPE